MYTNRVFAIKPAYYTNMIQCACYINFICGLAHKFCLKSGELFLNIAKLCWFIDLLLIYA